MFKISLDAGHGINTPGKRTPDDSLHEWQFNSEVVRYMQLELANYQDVAVLRVDDPTGQRDVPLKERTDRVNGWGSNVHVSIHANAAGSGWSDAHGIETYVYKTSLKEAMALAGHVQSSLVAATGLSDRGVKAGDLHMVRETHMTAILVEGPFMTNQQEAELLKSDDFRRKYAVALVSGIAAQYGLKKAIQVAAASIQPEPDSADGKLIRGERGPNVQLLNKMLHTLEYTTKTDDFFDQYTEAALKAFQKDFNLPQDAVYTSAIGQVMLQAIADKDKVKVDPLPEKAPEMVRLAKLIDTTNPDLMQQLKAQGYIVLDAPK